MMNIWATALTMTLAIGLTGCSVKRMAINRLGDALASGGTTFASDDDPELVKQAVPFSLKLMESLLAESPNHQGLLLATSSGFTQYGYAFVQQDADEIEAEDFAKAEAMRDRARRLYLRARDYGLRGLEAAQPGFTKALRLDAKQAVARLKKKHVAQLYWTAAAWGAAISLSKDDPATIAEIPQMEAMIDRALQLDESWGDGAIHGFLINYEMSRQGTSGKPAERARKHFDRAVELTHGQQAGPFVTYAEAVCVEHQDAKQFEGLLNRALAINPDEHPETRLVNLIMQRRARWLLSKEEDLFLNVPQPASH
jgi:predicted anti-sigma-YlaC factor YlaD